MMVDLVCNLLHTRFLVRKARSFVRNSLHISSVENEMEFGDMRGFAFILINLQYNCQNLSGMALA